MDKTFFIPLTGFDALRNEFRLYITIDRDATSEDGDVIIIGTHDHSEESRIGAKNVTSRSSIFLRFLIIFHWQQVYSHKM